MTAYVDTSIVGVLLVSFRRENEISKLTLRCFIASSSSSTHVHLSAGRLTPYDMHPRMICETCPCQRPSESVRSLRPGGRWTTRNTLLAIWTVPLRPSYRSSDQGHTLSPDLPRLTYFILLVTDEVVTEGGTVSICSRLDDRRACG